MTITNCQNAQEQELYFQQRAKNIKKISINQVVAEQMKEKKKIEYITNLLGK